MKSKKREFKKIGVLHGPNLNMLGSREPDLYGRTTLKELNRRLQKRAKELGMELVSFQSNHEGELVGFIQEHVGKVDAMVINPAAYTHTSVAIRDALLLLKCPVVEVHISNIFRRESFRHHSYVSDIAVGLISGFGIQGYVLALQAVAEMLDPEKSRSR